MRPIDCCASGRWYEGLPKVVEDLSRNLTILLYRDGDKERLHLGPRSQIRLIAYPTDSIPCDTTMARPSGWLSVLNPTNSATADIVKIFFRDPRDTTTMLSVLLGQKMSVFGRQATLNLDSASFERRSSGIRRVLRTSKPRAELDDMGRARAVQLWSEHSFRDPNTFLFLQRRDSPRTAREYLLKGPSPRRMVIYYENALLILRLAKNARVEKPKGDGASRTLNIVPTDKFKDPSFTVSLLTAAPSRGDGAASIPLSREELEAEEKKGSLECKAIQMVFRDYDDLYMFYKAYRLLKKQWHDDQSEYEKNRQWMGEALGWAPT
jgi:hypothetical protein